MNLDRLKELLEQIRSGQTSPDDALEQLKNLPFEDLGFAKIDHHRTLRSGMPEVIFGPGKSPSQLCEIFCRLAARAGNNVLATRVSSEQFAAVQQRIPQAAHNSLGRTLVLRQNSDLPGKGTIVIVSAGTSDTPVAEEAAVTAEIMGNCVERIFDVGVAGCIACSRTAKLCKAPACSSSAPAWKALCPASSAASSEFPLSPFPPASAMALPSEGSRRCWAC